jgi:hypothetical protein
MYERSCEAIDEKKIMHTKCYWLVDEDLVEDSIREKGCSKSSMYLD